MTSAWRQHQRARALAEELATHAEAAAQLKAERIAAYATNDERKAKALQKKAADGEARTVELEERRQGAAMAATAAQRDRFIAEHHAGLVAERAPIAHAAVKAIEDAAAALAAGVKAWHAESTAQVALLRPVPGLDGRMVPDLHIDQLVRDLQRAMQAGVPAPQPLESRTTQAKPRSDAGQHAEAV